MAEKPLIENVDEEKLQKKNKAKLITATVFLVLATIATVFSTLILFSLLEALGSGNAGEAVFGGLFLILFYIIAEALLLALAIPALTIALASKGKLSIVYIVISSLELLWAIGSFIYFVAFR